MEYKVADILDHDQCARFNEGGMEGAQRKKADRPVSLLSLSARQEVNAAELRGLCFKRFVADLTLDCEQMPEKGTVIKANELALGILQEGKTCWPECQLFQENLPCPLRDGVRYAWVEEPGRVCLDEVFKVVEPPNA